MSKKVPVPWTIAPLQRVVAEAITDPAEQAAIDKMRKQAKRKQNAKLSGAVKSKAKKRS